VKKVKQDGWGAFNTMPQGGGNEKPMHTNPNHAKRAINGQANRLRGGLRLSNVDLESELRDSDSKREKNG